MMWCILLEVASQLFQATAIPEVDLFPLADNAVVTRFFSIQHTDAEAIGLNAFHHPWQFLLIYAFPPTTHSADVSEVCKETWGPHLDHTMVAIHGMVGGQLNEVGPH